MKRIPLLLLTLLSGVAAQAEGPATSTTLLQAWLAAQTHDPGYRAAAAARDAGALDAARARALLLPGVQATATLGRSSIDSTTRGAQFSAPGFGTSSGVTFATDVSQGNATLWSIAAQQPLYDAERLASAAQWRTSAQIARLQFASSTQALQLAVARRYFDVLQTRDAADSRRLLAQATQRARDEAAARFDAGDADTLDRSEAQARLDLLDAQLLAAANTQVQAEAAWSDLTGLDAADITALPDTVPVSPGTGDTLADWQQRATQHSPLLAIRSLAAQSATREVDKYGALNGLRVDLVASVGRERLDGDGDYGHARISTDTTQFGVQASLPVFTGGMRSAQRSQARALARQAEAQRDAEQIAVAAQVRGAWQQWLLSGAQLEALSQALQSAAARLDATQIGLATGERSTLDLLNAEADLSSTRAQWRSARYERLYARLQLAAAAGVLDDTDLQAMDTALAASAQPQDNR